MHRISAPTHRSLPHVKVAHTGAAQTPLTNGARAARLELTPTLLALSWPVLIPAAFLNQDEDLFMQINSLQWSRAETEVFLIKAVPRRVSRNENGLQRKQLAVAISCRRPADPATCKFS